MTHLLHLLRHRVTRRARGWPCLHRSCRGIDLPPVMDGAAARLGADDALRSPTHRRVVVTTHQTVVIHNGGPGWSPPGGPPMAHALRWDAAWCAHVDELRAQSLELAVRRGHLHR